MPQPALRPDLHAVLHQAGEIARSAQTELITNEHVLLAVLRSADGRNISSVLLPIPKFSTLNFLSGLRKILPRWADRLPVTPIIQRGFYV